MQTTTRPPAEPGVARFTRAEYHRMADVGLFDGRRVQLLDGVIVEMPRMKRPHIEALNLARDLLLARLPIGYRLYQQVPIALGLAGAWVNSESVPEPDAAVYAGIADAPPVWVLEIADATLRIDLEEKPAIYARAGVQVYCVLDLNGRRLVIQTQPIGDEYTVSAELSANDAMTLPWSARPFRVAALLPEEAG
jgi:Uma2 family endonuclease